jgi:exonuclease SbcC
MRPVSLRLQAFGSYAGEFSVDFTRLSRHGIFAISGPTGAGKSTIFDALVYALFDDLPGFRVDGNVRSQYADASTPTWVSFDFVVHGDRWRVDRRPAQPERRRRGAGAPIERKSTVVLGRVGEDGELVPGSVVTRKDDVRRRIDGLIGLTKDQFEQVVLIPQGRFEEVLKADTAKRAPLLRRLFPVEEFARVTENLKAIAARRHAAFEEATRTTALVEERLQTAYEAAVGLLPDHVCLAVFGTHVPRELQMAQLTDQVGVLEGGLRLVDRTVATLASQAETARTRLADARRAATDWDRWQADLALAAAFGEEERTDAGVLAVLDRARRVADLGGVLAEYESAARRLATLEPELAALAQAIARTWPQELDADAWTCARSDAHEAGILAERIAAGGRRIQDEVLRFDRLVDAAGSLATRRAALADRRIELAERALKLDAEEEVLGLLSDEVETLRAASSGIDALGIAVLALERELDLASKGSAALAELSRFDAELEEQAAKAAAAQAHAETVRASWRDGLAGRLARLLAEGEPCPTCGSLEHPAPAEWQGNGADDETLEKAERDLEEALRRRGAVDQRAALARGVVVALTQTRPLAEVEGDLAGRREALFAARDAAGRLAVAAAEEARRREALREARERLGTESRVLEGDAVRLESDTTLHEQGMREFEEDHGAFASPAPRAAAHAAVAAAVERFARGLREVEDSRRSLAHCRAVLEPVAIELGAGDPGDLSAWILEPQELEARSSACEERRSRRDEVRRRIAEYETRFGAGDDKQRRPDVEALEAVADAATAAHVAFVARRALLADRLDDLAAGPGQIAESAHARDTARLELERAKTIADRCAGIGGGPVALRLSLENWVLTEYLRQVLVQANHRLDTMTEGRYALELSDGVTDGRKPWGLDLSVFDATTGQVRPATTLSGGETFMAALALALGLADVVSGGSNREVGALFVDEGFGSLDPQSLDSVIDVLRSLEDGGRIVGVVSHVRELQQALPSGITVEPSARGSVATVHYPPD